MVLIRLAPHRFALRLHPLTSTKNHDAAIKHAKAPLDLCGKIHMPRRIQKVHRNIIPFKRDTGRINRNPSLLLFWIEVGLSRALVDTANSVRKTSAVKHAFRHGRLAGVNVRNNPNIA